MRKATVMPIKTACPSCRKSYSLSDSQLGKKLRCNGCSEVFEAREEEEEEARPRRRAAARDRDEDDRPARRRDRADPDEEEEELSSRKAKKGGVPVLLFIFLGVGGFLLIGGIVGGIFIVPRVFT